jgi:hypothetical protein
MSCCGQNRQAMNAMRGTRISVTAEPVPPKSTRVTYGGAGSVLLRGPETGRSYWFTAEKPQQEVDARDLSAILATGLFG